MIDFFISYNRADVDWAKWIDWQLRQAGYSTLVQVFDFRPGCNFAVEMDRANAEAQRTIAVLSPDYLGALYTHPEWAAAFARDPTGEQGLLVPVRVRECKLRGLLAQIVYVDLVGVEEAGAAATLLAGLAPGERPATEPAFPGSPGAPRYPSEELKLIVARTSSTEPLDLFFSYSHRDEELRAELETHLASLKREGAIRTWHDREISAGLEWAGEIDQHLQEADLILLLISPDFMASDYCFDREMGRALERHEAAEARVIPIIARPTDWRTSGFARLQALPKDGKPITRWPDRDEAFLYVVRGLRRVIEEMQKSRKDSVEAARGRARASEEGVLAAADSGLEDRPDAEELRRLDQQRRPQPRRPLTGPLPSDLRRPLTSLPEQDDFDLDDSRWLAFDPDDRELVKQVLDLEETLQARQRKEDMAALLRKEALERGIKISEPRIDRLGREPYCVDGPFLVRAGTCGSAYPGVRRRGSRRRRRFRAFPRCRTATAAAHPDSRVRSSRSHLSARARVLRRLSLRCRGCPQKWATRVAIRDACSPNACARSRF